MIKYVLGFLIDNDRENVVLIKKSKPDWQKGKLNGVGGKIKKHETPSNAMVREFKEETGLEITNWKVFCILIKENDYEVYCYKAFAPIDILDKTKTMTDEVIYLVQIAEGLYNNLCITNLRWLLPLAAYDDGFTRIVKAYY